MLAGALAWLCKLVAASIDMHSPVVGFFYILGLTLLTIGSAGIALSLLDGRGRALRLLGAVLAPPVFLAIFLLLDSTLVPLTEDHVREWAKAEAGVLTAAVLSLAVAMWALRRAGTSRARVS